MAEETKFAIGATASCSDGPCGEVSRMIIDPATRRSRILSSSRNTGGSAAGPLDLVDTATGEIRLRCTLAEFDKLDRPRRPSYLKVSAPGSAVCCPEGIPSLPTACRMWFR